MEKAKTKRLEDTCKRLESEGYKTVILQGLAGKIDAVAYKGKIVLIEVVPGKTVITPEMELDEIAKKLGFR